MHFINFIRDDNDCSVLAITEEFKNVFRFHTHHHFPTEPYAQLQMVTEAVFISWNGKRAIDYRNAAGIRMTKDLSELKKEMPTVHAEFERMAFLLENHYRDMQDVEFTIEKGKLWMLQTRDGKRTSQAAG